MITQELCFSEAAEAGTEAVENKNASQNCNKHRRVITQDLNTQTVINFVEWICLFSSHVFKSSLSQ